MVTAVKAAAKSQRLVRGYPLPTDQYPMDFTLQELCSEYPNHLFGRNLYPFLQHRWSPNRIFSLMPAQDQVPQAERVTERNKLEAKEGEGRTRKAGKYQLLLTADKTNVEGTLVEAQEESGKSSDEASSSRTKGISNDPETMSYVGIFDKYRYSANSNG